MEKRNAINAWYGWVPDRPDHRDQLYSAIAAPPRKLPPAVDLRATCSPVENQGQLGSCTANALVGNLEFLEKKAGKPATDLAACSSITTSGHWKERSMRTPAP